MTNGEKKARHRAHRSRNSLRFQNVLNLEQLEQRLALSTVSALVADDKPPHVLSVSLPKPDTYGTGSTLTFKLNFNGDGTRDSRSVYLYGYSRVIPQGKTLKSITLPQNQNVRILDIKMGN